MTNTITVKFKRLDPHAKLPTKTAGNAGYDVYSLEDLVIHPYERKLVRTGLSIEMPEGIYARIAPRSGLAVKNGIDVLAGVVDPSYRDEIKVVIINFDGVEHVYNKSVKPDLFGISGTLRISKGDRIAQIIFENYNDVSFEETESLSNSDRKGGFGSTGR